MAAEVFSIARSALRESVSSHPFEYSAAGAALGSHVILQIHEPEPVEAMVVFLVTNMGLFKVLESIGEIETLSSIFILLGKLNLVYLVTLYTSIGLYRRYFHRCSSFPGPFWASLTKFWAFYTITTGNYSRNVLALHKKHGDYVRVGPREIDICNVAAINALYGSSTKCLKGPWYEGSLMGSHERFLQNEKPGPHIWKRRIWDLGFNSKALNGYEPRVLHYVNELISELDRRRKEGPVDIGLYFSFFTFDIMGDLGFGKGFDMLKNGEEHDYMTIVQGFAKFNALVCSIPWCATLFAWLPRDSRAEGLFTFAKDRVKERLPLGKSIPDIFSHILGEDRVTKQKYTERELVLESLMLTVGGSDTTSSSLATIQYYLVSHPEKYKRLKAEIDAYSGVLDHANLAHFAYLNAVVREALRLMPPIGSGMMHRMTPPEGITIDGTFIPGNTSVGVGAYAIQRDARYYGKPDEFIPERWLGEGPEPFDRNAFMTFSHGPYSCVGKHMAYMELCDVTAAMVRAFDLEFDPKYDPSSYERSIQDTVISSRAHLPMILKPRT